MKDKMKQSRRPLVNTHCDCVNLDIFVHFIFISLIERQPSALKLMFKEPSAQIHTNQKHPKQLKTVTRLSNSTSLSEGLYLPNDLSESKTVPSTEKRK